MRGEVVPEGAQAAEHLTRTPARGGAHGAGDSTGEQMRPRTLQLQGCSASSCCLHSTVICDAETQAE
jgi:hypothetical protein